MRGLLSRGRLIRGITTGFKGARASEGELFDVVELGRRGKYLRVDLTGHDLKLDTPLEIQSESKRYLGELYNRIGTVAYVRIRYSLTRGVRY